MTGDQADFVARLKSLLPRRWFPDTAPGAASSTPILDAACNGLAWGWGRVYALIAYAKLQSRIATATDVWLDLIALDFLAGALPRHAGETDAAYRARIEARIFRPVATRDAIKGAVTAVTGVPPAIIEPWNTGDCGALAGSGASGGLFAWNTGGCWGSLALPGNFFVQVTDGEAISATVNSEIAAIKAEGTAAWSAFRS